MNAVSYYDVIKDFWRSWKLLIGGTLALSALWYLPLHWIHDISVIDVYAEFRGYIGFAAICFAAVTASRVIVEASTLVGRWIQGIPEWRRRRVRLLGERNRTLRRLAGLSTEAKELLATHLDSGDPKIVAKAGDQPAIELYRAGLLTNVVLDTGMPYEIFRVTPWAWNRLRKDRSHFKYAYYDPQEESN